ncbi:MAG: conserved rane protein of unknown function [Alphaproteobacteria bacterium]|nr:conserved rane protein of unknown function [Alphaproteobacteria bacterium]
MTFRADENASPLTLIRADDEMIEHLVETGFLSDKGRAHAMALLYPARNWGIWSARLLLNFGALLVLSGIIYFYAFNWARIPPLVKLGSIEAPLLVCLGGAWFYKTRPLLGNLLLLSAAVRTGVFLAVFGQIYQTGADAWQLFMLWAALILPWVAISAFAPLWALWLFLTNVFLFLYWEQETAHILDDTGVIFSYAALFNAVFLALREYFVRRHVEWLAHRATRLVLLIPIFAMLLVPMVIFVFHDTNTNPQLIGAALAAIAHIGFYFLYRYCLRDIAALACVILSGCVVIEICLVRFLFDIKEFGMAFHLLTLGCLTLGLFTAAIKWLRHISHEMEHHNV